jgi:hypothetical protein
VEAPWRDESMFIERRRDQCSSPVGGVDGVEPRSLTQRKRRSQERKRCQRAKKFTPHRAPEAKDARAGDMDEAVCRMKN